MSEPIGALGQRLSWVVEFMIRDAMALTQDETLLSLLVTEPRGRA